MSVLWQAGSLPLMPHGFSHGSVGKQSSCNAGDTRNIGLIPGLVRSFGEGNGNPFQYSVLENPMDREDVGYSPWGTKELDMTE